MTLNCPKIICLLFVGLLALAQSTQALAETKLRLNFGVYTSNKPSTMVKVFRPVLKELEASMSTRLNREVDIRMQIAKDYDQGISHLVTGRVDISYFGPASYIEAKRMNSGIRIVAMENVKNSKVSYGIIAVSKDSPVQSITDLKGKSFAFGDEGSTIGRFLSQLELEQAGVRAVDLSRYEYLGRHDKVGTAVGAGAFDAGALNEKTFKKLVDAGENIRELVRFPNVSKPWIARAGLDTQVFEALRDSLLTVTNKAALSAMKIDGFLEGDDNDYSVIRKAMENNQAFFEEHDDIIQHESAANRVSNSATEPPMQAAIDHVHQAPGTGSNTDANSQHQIAAPSLHLTDTNHTHSNAASDTRSVILNIELPAGLFQSTNTNGPDSITINVKLPKLPGADE